MKYRIYTLFLLLLISIYSPILIHTAEIKPSKKTYWLLIKEKFNSGQFKTKLKHTLKIDEMASMLRKLPKTTGNMCKKGLEKIEIGLDKLEKYGLKRTYIVGGVATSLVSFILYTLSKMSPEERREALFNRTVILDGKDQLIGYVLITIFICLPLEIIFTAKDYYYDQNI